ncbi:hypothetical protein T310_3206 [Rasamsonia emersonii CBS 393.64]|uniref:Uncharacterized protein n=1 Tax=Rasamsonia emersonii (strain ATCC 16479 / CBS 393.64 / IMI 116815) TaxID=1408163 RepID=A0A0F4YWZ6_RASE3|nr:hypothetical protein T310_3206 [Rasamsonia emersonii CBS 393.64]KKA22749.1 hypothetical protein T310_3206 [Rasamsonia emersonii CBS 393.64]
MNSQAEAIEIIAEGSNIMTVFLIDWADATSLLSRMFSIFFDDKSSGRLRAASEAASSGSQSVLKSKLSSVTGPSGDGLKPDGTSRTEISWHQSLVIQRECRPRSNEIYPRKQQPVYQAILNVGLEVKLLTWYH